MDRVVPDGLASRVILCVYMMGTSEGDAICCGNTLKGYTAAGSVFVGLSSIGH